MQLNIALLIASTSLSSLTLAAPPTNHLQARTNTTIAAPSRQLWDRERWTLQQLRREGCDDYYYSFCFWSFNIKTEPEPSLQRFDSEGHLQEAHPTTVTPCSFATLHQSIDAYDQDHVLELECGPYSVTAARSNADPDENGEVHHKGGLHLLVISDPRRQLIIYPLYWDEELDGGKIVEPDRWYHNLPTPPERLVEIELGGPQALEAALGSS